ncbi:MAG: BamA/TamA family outer membrane protein [Hahellaceae bacterium]|nr:BamA/TamA family outer membrane protein [Hahellaceae bacterium]MCP5169223.1 BamA/TamA family outer membrane protein [Hahellaceae bacterium]
MWQARVGYAFEIPLLTLGPEFELNLQQKNNSLADYLREGLVTQRNNDPEFKLYSTTARFARTEQLTLQKLLRAKGYYRAEVTPQVLAEKIIYGIDTGPRYLIEHIRFDVPTDINFASQEQMLLAPNQPLEADAVLKGLDQFSQLIEQENCLFEVHASYEARINHDTRRAEVIYRVQNSTQAVFGSIRLAGLSTVNPDYLRSKLGINSGDCFNRKRLEKARLALLRTNLIASIDENLSHPANGKVDVDLQLVERHHKTVKAGGGYSTDEGPFTTLGWEHRNLFDAGQIVTLSTRLSSHRQSLEGVFTVPEFVSEDQKLEVFSELAQEDLDAYESKRLLNGFKLTTQLNPVLSLAYGAEFKFSEVIDETDPETFGLLYFPIGLKWDTTDNILDSRQGWTLNTQWIPYIDMLDTGTHFYKTIISGSAYHTLNQLPASPTLAVKLATGGLTGASLNQVPSDERYYVGGGGSVRGYNYQSLSTLDGNNDPEGGRSFNEISLETRLHHGPNWGTVWFVDGGYAYDATLPDFTHTLRWSTGVGLRYFTSFAPLRFDIAWPLNRRRSIDNAFQLYISLGQAF